MSPLPHAVQHTMVDDQNLQQSPITIVNDIRSAFEQLSPLGQQLLRNDIDQLAAHLDTLTTRHQWPLVDHGEFDRWLTQTSAHDMLLILDKLALHGPPARPSWVRLDAHRRLTPDAGLHLALGDLEKPRITESPRSTVTIVDDAAYTGATLDSVAKRLTELGVDTIRARVAVSTPRAIERLNRRGVEVITFAPLSAPGDIIHARDLYPWLPHSGRQPQFRLTDDASPQRSIAPLYHRGGNWLSDGHLATDPVLHQLASAGLTALQNHLGREVLPEDVALLGSGVSVPVCQVTTTRPLGVPMLTHAAFHLSRTQSGSVCGETLRGEGTC